MGGAGQSTIWKGTAFDCPHDGDSISLLHNANSDSNTTKQCNDGLIVANLISDSARTGYYTSQLYITVNLNLIGRTVECFHDNHNGEILIGNMTILPNRSG